MENNDKTDEYIVKNKFEDQMTNAKTGFQVTFINKEKSIEDSKNKEQEE